MKTIKNISSKLIKVTAVVTLTLGSFYIKAGNGLIGTAEETQKTIREHVKFPKFIMPLQKSEKIEVVFTTAENGKVNFVFAKTENKTIKTEIEKQFHDLTLNKLKANVAYSIVFNFKTI